MASRRRDTPPRRRTPAFWANLSSEFQSLKEEEPARARMFAEGQYVTGSPYCGAWWLRDAVSENFQVRFDRVARQAGSALGPLEGVPLLTFWLHELHHNLRKHRSHLLQTFSSSGIIRGVRWKGGGVYIYRVCEASETFCLRLEEQARKQAESLRAQNSTKQPAGHNAPSEKTRKLIRAVADLVKILESPMKQVPKSERLRDKGPFTSLLKAVGITDQDAIELARQSNTAESAAKKIVARKQDMELRTLENICSRVKASKA